MNLNQKVLLLFICLGIYMPIASAQGNFDQEPFYEGTIDQMRRQAKNFEKPYILFFHADWSVPSREVEDKCLMDNRILSLLDQNYFIYKADLESRATSEQLDHLADLYKVSLYPTFIFFSPEGRVLRKMAGKVDIQSFENELLEIYSLSTEVEAADVNGEIGEVDGDWIPEDFFPENEDEIQEIVIIDEFESDEVTEYELVDPNDNDDIEVIDEADTWNKKPAPKPSPNKDLEGPKEMFAIQLGAFSKLSGAQQKLNEVQTYTTFPAEIIEKVVKGKKYYKVVVGPYASKGKAEVQRVKVMEEIGGERPFIITIPRF
ncbi:MAG: SPOR domain-containing protein [Bacteroidota bacterium]